jgi:GT2 family glycosyltransferase
VSEHHEIVIYLFLHSAQEDVVQVCEQLAWRTNVFYFPFGQNRGLAKSWNEGILAAYGNGCEAVIVANDDIVFSPGDVDEMAETAVKYQNFAYLVTAEGYNHRTKRSGSMGYSCFAVNPLALEKIGMFDENFFPIYFEDCDYEWRARQLGLARGHCEHTHIEHGGSSALHDGSDEYKRQHQLTFQLNSLYYRKKWGGLNEQETYEHPFNDPSLGHYIAPEDRHRPYGEEYDREDQSLVRV